MPAAITEPQLTDVASALDALLSWVRRNAPSLGHSLTARTTLGRLRADGPARISDLARLEGVSQPAMTGLMNRLETEGLVRRDPDPSDARAALVVLTQAGVLLIEQYRADRGRLLAVQLERLAVADQRALLLALPALEALANLPVPASQLA